MVTVKTLWQATSRVLQDGGMDTPVADARLLMQSILKMTREDVLMKSEREVMPQEIEALQPLIDRRLKHEPVSRILGTRAFWKSDYIVTPDTLDPRPDSETLIYACLYHAPEAKRILDCGTGTGCLLISLLQEMPEARGVGLDISEGAAEVAQKNAEMAGVATRAEFIAADWEKFKSTEPFDLIVSNPPYIALSEKKDLAPDVALYDPPAALFAGEDGLAAYRSLARILPPLMADGGVAVFEIGHSQARSVTDILAKGGFDVIETRQDLGGSDRVLIAKKH